MPWVGAQQWVVRDNFGERWRLRVLRPFDAVPPPAEDSSYRYPISRLVYGAFDQFGPRGEGDVARGLLEAYDELTGASLSARVPNLASDRQRLLFHFNEHLQETLHRGAAAGRLVVEHVAPMPWPFPDLPDQPAPYEPQPVVQEETTFVGVRLVDQGSNGVANAACEVSLPDGSVVKGSTGAGGILRLEGISAAGTCRVVFADFDVKDFARPTPLMGSRSSDNDAVTAANGGDTVYKVGASDTLASIARQFGFANYETIWNAPENAGLRKRRVNPQALLEGDEVIIPKRNPAAFSIATGTERTLYVFLAKVHVRIGLLTSDVQRPAATHADVLALDAPDAVDADDNGVFDVPIAANASALTLDLGGATTSCEIGLLSPVETRTGIRQRLWNLGYDAGDDDDDHDTDGDDASDEQLAEALAWAVEEFEKDKKMDPTPNIDTSFLDKLTEAHGS